MVVQVFPRLNMDYSGSSIESFRGFDILAQSDQYGSRISALVEGVDPTRLPDDLASTADDVRGIDGVARVIDPTTAPPEAGVVAPDGSAVLLLVDLKTSAPTARTGRSTPSNRGCAPSARHRCRGHPRRPCSATATGGHRAVLRRLHTRIGLREHVDVPLPDGDRSDATRVTP